MYAVDLTEHLADYESLHQQEKVVHLAPSVNRLRAKFMQHRAQLLPLRVWMVSSTARGGGVAEMLPRIMALMRELGMTVEWLIMDAPESVAAGQRSTAAASGGSGGAGSCSGSGSETPSTPSAGLTVKQRFFSLTKHLHNNIHGTGEPLDTWTGCGWEARTSRAVALGALNEVTLTHQRAVNASQLRGRQEEDFCAANVARLRQLFEAVAEANTQEFFDRFCVDPDPDRELIIIHDPQPSGMIPAIKKRFPTMSVVWRCHIGVDISNPSTAAAWSFLQPYVTAADACVFSSPEYIPDYLKSKSAIVHPGIAPLAPKNKELSAYEVTQILMRAGLMDQQQRAILQERGCELTDPPFKHRARIYTPADKLQLCSRPRSHSMGYVASPSESNPLSSPMSTVSSPGTPLPLPLRLPLPGSGTGTGAGAGSGAAAGSSSGGSGGYAPRYSSPLAFTATNNNAATGSGAATGTTVTGPGPGLIPAIGPGPGASYYDLLCSEEGIAFLHRPVVAQISRWDRLKGWKPLMAAWRDLKMNREAWVTSMDLMTPQTEECHNVDRHRRMIANAALVLAGPDPRAIQDDPEGQECLAELKAEYDALPVEVQKDVKIVELPMADVKENALIVNAIQRAAIVLVQASSREGFGLTATEAMYKRTLFIGTEQAVGLRTQVRHGVDGILVQGDPTDPLCIARALNTALGNEVLREQLAINGQKRAVDCFLLYTQLLEWMFLAVKMLEVKEKMKAAARAGAISSGSAAAASAVAGGGGGGAGSAAAAAKAAALSSSMALTTPSADEQADHPLFPFAANPQPQQQQQPLTPQQQVQVQEQEADVHHPRFSDRPLSFIPGHLRRTASGQLEPPGIEYSFPSEAGLILVEKSVSKEDASTQSSSSGDVDGYNTGGQQPVQVEQQQKAPQAMEAVAAVKQQNQHQHQQQLQQDMSMLGSTCSK